MLFALYGTLALNNQYIRCKDGVYDLIRAPGYNDPDDYDYINAPGQPCDQSWAENVQKENLIVNQAMAQVFYNIPDGVEVITTLNGVEVVERKHTEPTNEPERPPEADEIETRRRISETKQAVAQAMEKFPAEDKKALRHIATDAMSGNQHARSVLTRLFPNVQMDVLAFYTISNEGYKAMTPHEQEVDYIVATRELNALNPASQVSQAPSVAARRLELGMTQKQLAEKSGINIRMIQKLESCEAKLVNITAKNLLTLADALEIDPHDLLR